MPDNREDINAILSELRKVLSDLTKEEKEHAEETIEKKLDEMKVDEKKHTPAKSIYPPAIEESIPQIEHEPKVKVEPIPSVPSGIKEETSLHEIQMKEKPDEVVIQQESQITEQPAEKSIKEEIPQEQVPVTVVNIEQKVEETPLIPEELPQQKQTFETVTQLQAEIVEKVEEGEVKQDVIPAIYIPPFSGSETQITYPVLNLSLIYPTSEQSIKDIFIKNLTEIIKKTSKKPFYFKMVMERTYNDINEIDWNEQLNQIVALGIQVVFFISPQKMDFSRVINLYKSSDIFFMVMTVAEVAKKITYVDMIIELMLTKKVG